MRYLNIYGDPSPWQIQSRGALYTFMSFINVTKYPPSLLFLLLTLGIIFIGWPIYENWHGKASEIVLCYGKVSLFFYVIHLYLVNAGACLYSIYVLHYPSGWWWGITPWSSLPWPSNYHPNLLVAYVAWAVILIIMYPLCFMYKNYKSSHNYAWLSYL